MKNKTYSARDFRRLLYDNGYEYIRSKGDHDIFKGNGRIIVIPIKLNKMIARRLIKENNLIE